MPRLLSLPAIPIFLLVSATIADSTLFAIFWTASFRNNSHPPRQALELIGDHDLTDSRARYLNSVWNRGDIDVGRLQRHREEIIRLYDAGIHWADEQIGILVNATRRFGMWDQCVLALTADHGEEFLEHGGRFHAPSKITEELIRVPLLIRVPGGIATRTHNAINKSVFNLMHLAQTLLDTVGIAISSCI